MRADEVEIGGGDVGRRQRGVDRRLQAAAVRIGRGHVRGVAGAAVAEQPAQPRTPHVPLAGEEHQPGGLAQQQAAPAAIERTHALARERAQHVEATQHEAAQDVAAAGHHEVGGALAQQVGADAERGGAGGARRRHG